MFPGASSGDPADAAYAIFGAPLETSTTFYPGTRFGPELIRHHARGFEDYDHRTGLTFSDRSVVDVGDVRAWNDAEGYVEFLAGEVGAAGGVPVLLGGEHTISVAGVRALTPDLYVSVDAHLDLRTGFEGDPWSHATATHHVREAGVEAVILGARAGSREEWERLDREDGVSAVPVDDVERWLADSDIEDRDVYVSVDVDGIDPGYAPATGTREPFGLDPTIVRAVLTELAPALVGADVVEVNDRDDGQTATLAAKLVRRLIFSHAEAHA